MAIVIAYGVIQDATAETDGGWEEVEANYATHQRVEVFACPTCGLSNPIIWGPMVRTPNAPEGIEP